MHLITIKSLNLVRYAPKDTTFSELVIKGRPQKNKLDTITFTVTKKLQLWFLILLAGQNTDHYTNNS